MERSIRRSLCALAIVAALPFAHAGCTDTSADPLPDGGQLDFAFTDSRTPPCNPNEDWDKDGIPNGEEGCLFGRDSDSDGTPDWQDFDSDGDGIRDAVEAGAKGKCLGKAKDRWPCDSDADGIPDYIDVDSDGDSINDGDEDYNGDGLLGCCLVECNNPQGAQKPDNQGNGGCILNDEGCGGRQKCVEGKCVAPVHFSCSEGETNPRLKDSFNDGKFDNERGTFICRDATEDKPEGRKTIKKVRSLVNPHNGPDKELSGDWHLALEKSAKYGEMTIASPKAKEAVAAIDHEDSQHEVAGFVLSMPASKANIQEELAAIISAITAKPPGGTGTVSVRASGTAGKSHDHFDTIRNTILDVSGANTNISTARNELMATILGRTPADITNMPGPFGSSGADFVIRFTTVRRFAFKKNGGTTELDKDGYPIEDEAKTEARRILLIGAVALRANYQDPSRQTGVIVDDLSGGTALAAYTDTVENECSVGSIESLPVADIIWVVDESGSTDTHRTNIVNNANAFFSRALASGLDFRMGVTSMAPNGKGIFCSDGTGAQNDTSPGSDRFLRPDEQKAFSDCIKNPPGYDVSTENGLTNAREAVLQHLPRAPDAPNKIRVGAKLVIILVTDEGPSETSSIEGTFSSTCQLSASKQSQFATALQPHLDLYKGVTDPDGAAQYHVIGGVCNNSCGAGVAHGYRELAQQLSGQIGDICQKDLGNTLQVIIDSIAGIASPVDLTFVPVASSLAVAVDGVEVPRSRTAGFDYRAEPNKLIFINIKYQKGSEVVASYKRWARQVIPL